MKISFLGQGFEPESVNSVGNILLRLFKDEKFNSFYAVPSRPQRNAPAPRRWRSTQRRCPATGAVPGAEATAAVRALPPARHGYAAGP